MNKVVTKIVHEMKTLLPVTAYFLFANELIALTYTVSLGEYGITAYAFLRGVIIALVVAKVVLVADMLPLMRAFDGKPAIYSTLWCTFVYFVGALLLQVSEGIIKPLFSGADLAGAYQIFVSETAWSRFALVQIWLFVLLFNYCLVRQISRLMGSGKLTAAFFRERQ